MSDAPAWNHLDILVLAMAALQFLKTGRPGRVSLQQTPRFAEHKTQASFHLHNIYTVLHCKRLLLSSHLPEDLRCVSSPPSPSPLSSCSPERLVHNPSATRSFNLTTLPMASRASNMFRTSTIRTIS